MRATSSPGSGSCDPWLRANDARYYGSIGQRRALCPRCIYALGAWGRQAMETASMRYQSIMSSAIHSGNLGSERENLGRLITDLKLDPNVSMLGHLCQSEMERQLAPAWVQVVPSRLAEPFGLAAAEGMMRGTAVVAANAGGLVEIVQDGRTGLLVPPSDINALAKALLHLLKNCALAEKMGRAGREKAMTCFSHKTFIDKFINLYQSLLKRK